MRRVLLRAGIFLGFVSAVGFGLRQVFRTRKVVQPLEQVFYSTNGVLKRTWFLSNVKVPFGEGLMTIDLNDLQRCCRQYTQIEAIHIVREFPNALRIQVQEYQPCAKLLLSKNGQRSVGLVSKEGVIFDPIQYDRRYFKTVPTVSDIPKRLIKNSKITGFPFVFRLLQFLNFNAPDVFQAVCGLSLKHFDPFLEKEWQTIELDIGGHWTLVFPLERPEVALARFRSILQSLSPEQRKSLRRLNVARIRPTVEFL